MGQHFETVAVKGTLEAHSEGSALQPIYQSSTFRFQNEIGYDNVRYTRCNNNPNHVALAAQIAALEGTEAAMVASSGMAAITTALLTFLRSGDHLLIQNSCYGGTYDFVTKNLAGWNISHSKIDASRPDSWAAALKPNTKIIYVETICNPSSDVPKLDAIVSFARANGLISFIDNTFASPALCRPADLGFDIVLESLTKYMGGHSDLIAGSYAGSRENVRKHQGNCLTAASHTAADTRRAGFISFKRMKRHAEILQLHNHLGGSLDPNSIFLVQRGIKTLSLRIRQACANALALAEFLQQQPQVESVCYSGLKGHRDHGHVLSYLGGHAGGVFRFDLTGSLDDGQAFLQALQIPLLAPSLGSVETLITQPALTSHAGLTPEERKVAGIRDGTIRVAVGIENIEDLIADFKQALQAIGKSR